MQNDINPQRRPGRQEQSEENIGRIERPGLTFGEEGEAAVDRRIPQRQFALRNSLGEEMAEGIVLHHHVLDEEGSRKRRRWPEENRHRRADESNRAQIAPQLTHYGVPCANSPQSTCPARACPASFQWLSRQ